MNAQSITLTDITSADWSLKLGAIGSVVQGLADVEQCLEIIVTTPKGSDPLRPAFGADLWRYIDFPINTALPAIVREVTAAVTVWEPRVTLISVGVSPGTDAPAQAGAQLAVTITWRLKLGGAATPAQTTTVTIP
jgi:Bacteriophage baseplate protein W